MRMLCAIAVLGCGKSTTTEPVTTPPPATVVTPRAGTCGSADLVVASRVLGDPAHPCRTWVEKAYGRLLALPPAFSATIVSTSPVRGAGLVVTCQHCVGAGGASVFDPESDPPPVWIAKPPVRFAGNKLSEGSDEKFYFAYRLVSPEPPKSAFDAKGALVNIRPADDFVVGTLSGSLNEVVGHLGVIAPPTVDDRDVPLDDPGKLAATSTPWGEAVPGALVMALGFPRDLPDLKFEGELVASFGVVLDDATAKARIARAEPEEAAIPYDPAVELVVAARGISGMSGGGVFDEAGRFVGVSVRGTLTKVDGSYLLRVVRAPYIARRLASAIAEAAPPLRAKLAKFVP